MGVGVSPSLDLNKIIQEKWVTFTIIYTKPTKSSCITFHACVDIHIMHTIFILSKLCTSWQTQFCVFNHTANSFIFGLAYTTCTNPILRENLNYKKLLKMCLYYQLIRMNSICKKAKNVLIPPRYLFPI